MEEVIALALAYAQHPVALTRTIIIQDDCAVTEGKHAGSKLGFETEVRQHCAKFVL